MNLKAMFFLCTIFLVDKFKLLLFFLVMHHAVNGFALTGTFPSIGYFGDSMLVSSRRSHLRAPDGNRAKFQFTHKIMTLVSHAIGSDSYSNIPGIYVSRPIGLISVEPNNHHRIITNNSAYKEKGRIFTNTNSGKRANPPQFLLVLNGNIGNNKVNVSAPGWVDYSFGHDSDLMPLSDVEAFNKKNGHLLNSPTEKEVIDEGPNLLEMNIKVLEKIEEQTLYVIALNKKRNQFQLANIFYEDL